MSGIGKRFQKDGYVQPKYMIKVLGKSIIEHVISMFPNVEDILFIVNKEHLNNSEFKIKDHLRQIAPTAKIFEIESHNKGPGWAVLAAKDLIDLERPVIVNYCDFHAIFNYDKLKEELLDGIDGLILTYDGFHPHMIRSQQFAYVKKNSKDYVIEIQEKKPFTNKPREEEASTGTYGFKNGRILIESLEEQISFNDSLNGEYYISLTYKSMLRKKMNVRTLKVKYFMQWGTPEDLNDFNYWSDIFLRLVKINRPLFFEYSTKKLILAAGNGKRFSEAGYKETKCLLDLDGSPIIERILQVCGMDRSMVLLRRNQTELINFLKKINAEARLIESETQGQAESAYLGIKDLFDQQILIAPCDSLLVSNEMAEFDESDTDLLVFTTKRLPNSNLNPAQYGWVHCEKNTTKINRVIVKDNPDDDNWDIFTGAMLVKSSKKLSSLIEVLLSASHKVNSEYYLDQVIEVAIEAGLNVKKKEADLFISLGTPNEYESFSYWLNCFRYWKIHPFSDFQKALFK
jgi:bifunctional N-acetylglucosamine-1-phosphate-uridyltransferase/glucosamine-1-phosphate-acetyltransferase GlmU-like protein